MSDLLAHSANDHGLTHPLADHLAGTAMLAERFGSDLGAPTLARWAGLLHDLGKASPDFQRRLRQPEGKHSPVDHKTAGALEGARVAEVLSFIILGHHHELPSRAEVKTRLLAKADDADVRQARAARDSLLPGDLPPADARTLLPRYLIGSGATRLETEFFVRMLYSALVDADYLDTELHFSAGRASTRLRQTRIDALWARFAADQEHLKAMPRTAVNVVRNEVLEACLDSATRAPGLFSLTAPTGGGKTRSSLAFALKHALANDQRRVIFAIPYTTIIEQTAVTYREILGADAVVEHHSAVDEDRAASDDQDRLHLATENWDARLIVTTNVQLFESLFSNRPGRCRKLHNLARSVIVLDEVQTLPETLLTPIVSALSELVTHYGCTVLLCTATQPAFRASTLRIRLPVAHEIVYDPDSLFTRLKRVRYSLPQTREERWTWDDVAHRMADSPQALAVVNTKKDALALLDALGDPDALHLSTLLCGAHRRAVLREVRARLAEGRPCHLVSTQVVEAGVDLDFPLVLRAVGPLDRIVQAAGRCNREGRLPEGEVVIFRPAEGSAPPGPFRTGMEQAEAMLSDRLDLHSPSVFRDYFTLLYQAVDTDSKHIQELREGFDFPEVAQRFRVISDDTVPVLVHAAWLTADTPIDLLVTEIVAGRAGRDTFRALQPYLVSLRLRQYREARRQGLIHELIPDSLGTWLGAYDNVRGIAPGQFEPDALVVI